MRDAATIRSIQLTQQLIALALVALSVRWFNVLFGVCAATRKRDNMVKMQDVFRQDNLIANIAMHSIAHKNAFVANAFRGYISSSCVVVHPLLCALQRVRLSPRLQPLAVLFAVSRIVLLMTAFCLLFVEVGVSRFELSRILSLLFFVRGSILLTPGLVLLLMSSAVVFILLILALLTVSAVSIFAVRRFRESIKRLFFVATGTDLRGKQWGLSSVIRFTHSYGPPIQVRSLGVQGGCNVLRTEQFFPHYTTNPPLKPVYPTFRLLPYRCMQCMEVY